MASTTTSGRSIILPDLSGWFGADALDELDGLGLGSATCFIDVEDVREAGYVVGQDPPPNQPCRKKQLVQLNIGKHPDYDPAELIERITQEPASVQPSLAAPYTFPSGRTDGQHAAGTPWTAAAAADGRVPAAPSSILPRPLPPTAAAPTPVAPTPPTRHSSPNPQEHHGAVPTPDQYAPPTSQPRVAPRRPGPTAPSAGEPATAPGGPAQAPLEEETVEVYDFSEVVAPAPMRNEYVRPAGRKPRKRRRFQRLPLKQKLIAGGIGSVLLLLLVFSISSHPAKGHNSANTHPFAATGKTTSKRHHRAIRNSVPTLFGPPTHAKAATKTPAKPKVRTIVRVRTIVKRGPVRTRTITVTVASPTTSEATAKPTSSWTNPTSPSTASTPSSTHTATAVHSSSHADSGTTTSSTSRPTTSDTSKGGGGSALQTPDGGSSPPTPTQP